MNKRKKSFLFLAIIVFGVLLSPIGLNTFIYLNAWNPMLTQFVVTLIVENQATETIYVTPISTSDKGNKFIAVQYGKKSPAFKTKNDRDIPIASKATIEIYYLSDHSALSEVLLRGRNTPYLQAKISREDVDADILDPPPLHLLVRSLIKIDQANPDLVKLLHRSGE